MLINSNLLCLARYQFTVSCSWVTSWWRAAPRLRIGILPAPAMDWGEHCSVNPYQPQRRSAWLDHRNQARRCMLLQIILDDLLVFNLRLYAQEFDCRHQCDNAISLHRRHCNLIFLFLSMQLIIHWQGRNASRSSQYISRGCV